MEAQCSRLDRVAFAGFDVLTVGGEIGHQPPDVFGHLGLWWRRLAQPAGGVAVGDDVGAEFALLRREFEFIKVDGR